jgi:hypothetical protein
MRSCNRLSVQYHRFQRCSAIRFGLFRAVSISIEPALGSFVLRVVVTLSVLLSVLSCVYVLIILSTGTFSPRDRLF